MDEIDLPKDLQNIVAMYVKRCAESMERSIVVRVSDLDSFVDYYSLDRDWLDNQAYVAEMIDEIEGGNSGEYGYHSGVVCTERKLSFRITRGYMVREEHEEYPTNPSEMAQFENMTNQEICDLYPTFFQLDEFSRGDT